MCPRLRFGGLRARRFYGTGARSGSTSRPQYVLQVGHIWCGRLGRWQTGHSLTGGASSLWVARRLSRRAFDVFLLGTAIAAGHYSYRSARASGSLYARLLIDHILVFARTGGPVDQEDPCTTAAARLPRRTSR